MNTELELRKGKAIVKDEHGVKTERNLSNNIEQILITENNIEELEEIIDNSKRSIKLINEGVKVSYLEIGIGISLFILSAICYSGGNFLLLPITLLCSSLWVAKGYFITFKPEQKKIKLKKIGLNIYENKLNEEKEKLKLLNKKEKQQNNSFEFNNESRKILKTSDLIESLREKQEIINDYLFKKELYIELYKKGTLKKELELIKKSYLFDFIELLIQNDLNIKVKNINKQKILKK